MRQAMANAIVGDDVLGDDPTVIELQDEVAALFGKEAACFVPSGTMANQTAIRAHTEPGDEILCHPDSHIIHYETGAPAALSGVMIRPVDGELGQFDAAELEAAVRPASSHYPCSKLLLIENTQNRGGGAVWPIDKIERVSAAGRKHGLRVHLDGARIWNACAATGLAPAAYGKHFDTISCCFSKGLGSPVGSAVCGSRATITRVHRFRKLFGGAMRQAGILAAAALHALRHHRERLVQDHANARRLGGALAEIPGVSLAFPVETNMVFIDLAQPLPLAAEACERLQAAGVWALPTAQRRIRMVTHLDVSAAGIEQAIALVRSSLLVPATSGKR